MAIYVRNKEGDLSPLNIPAIKGKDGVTPKITVGEVTTLPAGEKATVEMGGNVENPILNFGIPKGRDGDGVGYEKLIVDYTHAVGTIINITDLDISTGIFTTDMDISLCSGETTPIKKDGVNYLSKDDIPKELQGVSNQNINILSKNTFKLGSISTYSKVGDLSKYCFITNKAGITLKNAFEHNKSYRIRIESASPGYASGLELKSCVTNFDSNKGVVIGYEQYNNYLQVLHINDDYAINGYVADIVLDNNENEFDLNIQVCASGLLNDSVKNSFRKYVYKYKGGIMTNLVFVQHRNVIPKGSKVKIWEVSKYES